MPQDVTSVTPSMTKRNARGQYAPGNRSPNGFSVARPADPGRARRALNQLTIDAMTRQFEIGGEAAIAKVRKNQPALFLKMLVLLVPRELEVTHSGGVKGMSDEQLEGAIATLEALMARRAAGEGAKVIEAQVEPVAEGVSASKD